jgi:exopolyphosphatase/guanosine-5'-triphosphate,3'-diphosphate pyrophosphatase
MVPGDDGRVVGASVDLGATSVHLLVAAVDGHQLEPLIDESVFLGLGRTVADRGHLGPTTRAALTEALVAYAATARGLGAGAVTLVGTEPIRRAADAAWVVRDAARRATAPLHVLSHEEEAFLTLIGVTAGRPVGRDTLIVDVGGGSSEFCFASPGQGPSATGIRLGASLLADASIRHDPPLASELAEMRDAARVALRTAPEARPDELVAVGGTASNLVKVAPEPTGDEFVTPERIEAAEAELRSAPAAVVAERHLINPRRAGILAAGAAIMTALLERYEVDAIRVADAGIREGTVLAVAHAGAAWRDRLLPLARGWD